MKRPIIVLTVVLLAAAFAWPDGDRPAVTGPNGERCVAGQLLIELDPSLRGRVAITEQDGIALFGVPALDELSRRWQVDDVTALYRRPDPDPIAMRWRVDLVYAIQFPVDRDLGQVATSYEALAEVSYACPNALMDVDDEPNDPDYYRQWHLPMIGAPIAWSIAKGSQAVTNLVIDDGCDWGHPDVEANLWINTLEDINGNGRFDTLPPPDGDLDGIDQDANNYTDDVIGWDFMTGDPDPTPLNNNSHGTHCWGNINAVTNNATGVAGATWNSRSMAVRCGNGETVELAKAIAAIDYAVPLGVWAISMSFGGNTQYVPMRDACGYAWDSGAVLFGSAGNESVEARRYPACYDGVENVAASSPNDLKASFSNYGTWVDVTAPGEGIYATYARGAGSYGTMDGTSMSAPLAAGVACWMKSWDPTMSNVTCTLKMHAACDSMPDPLYAEGKLGAGRVSMANVVLPLYYCNLTLSDWRFNDASGNGNGRPDPGETVALVVEYSNSDGWRDATGVTATVVPGDPEVQVIKGTASFPDIAAGASGNCSADSFVVTLPATVPPEMLDFWLTVQATPEAAWPDTSFKVQAGDPRVLLVDDDLGADYERWYTAALDSNGVLWKRYDVQAGGSPPLDTLDNYPVVFWFTGDDSATTLTGTDMTNLGSYLDDGGKLMISGQNIAQQLQGQAFLADYLHASFVDASTRMPYMVGYAGDPITDGDTMVSGGGGGANNGSSLDGVRPANGGIGGAYFRDYADTTVRCVVRYSTDAYQVVFFSVPFEALDHSTTRYLQKWTLVERILGWFGERLPGVAELPRLAGPRPYVLSISPSPFSTRARVDFIAPVSGPVELRTYSTAGRLVDNQTRTVTLGERAWFELDGARLSNGVYLVQLVTPDGVFAQKTAVLR